MTNKPSDNANRKGLVSIFASLPLIRRIKTIKELFLEKLDFLNENFNNFDRKINLLLQNDTPLLRVSIAITKSLQSIQQAIQELLDELRKSFTISSIQLSEMNDKVTRLERKVETSQKKLSGEFQALVDIIVGKELKTVDNQLKVVHKNDVLSNPEVGLMCYLYSYLPSRCMIEIGANLGETSQFLLKLGYEVYSFDVKSLVDLHNTQEIPSDVGLVKIDTEGYDIQVIQGMGSYRYSVLVAKFRDVKFPFDGFGTMYQLEGLVQEMKTKNYNWHIVIYQVSGNNTPSFYSNYPQSIENSWGNVFFFQDYGIFSKALTWCSTMMPETYIQSVNSRTSST